MNNKNHKKNLSYKDAGVNINEANALISDIKTIAAQTPRQGVLNGIGGFGALYALPTGYREPVLVSGTDGVGTKLKLAIEQNKHDTIGIDLVAMCVNDIITCGAKPMFFLDYYATAALDKRQAKAIITGIGVGCKLAEIALVGGETAEMPGMYRSGDYDLAGFSVGIVEKSKIITGHTITHGDKLIAIASSGPHANGYSLIRNILRQSNTPLSYPFSENSTVGDVLLEPTRILVRPIMELLNQFTIKAIAHITGGGITENIPRVLPPGTTAIIDQKSWHWPEIFKWLQQNGNVTTEEMLRTFNCGVAMVICANPENEIAIIDLLTTLGETCWTIGHIQACEQQQATVNFS